MPGPRLSVVVASSVFGGWIAGVGFGTLLLPELIGLAETGAEYFLRTFSDSEEEGWSGTGFVAGSTGHVLTNYHVVEGCSELRGRLQGLTIPSFDVVGQDKVNDVAVLKPSVDVPPGPRLRSGHMGNLGEKITVAGYPDAAGVGINDSCHDRDHQRPGGFQMMTSPCSRSRPLFSLGIVAALF